MTLIDKAEALLPCPFCGGEARTYRYNGTTQATCARNYTDCAGTDVSAPVAMWNRRAALAPTDAPHVNETPKSQHDGADVLTAAQAREAALMEAHKAILAMDTKKDEDLTYNLAVLRAAEKVRRLIDEART